MRPKNPSGHGRRKTHDNLFLKFSRPLVTSQNCSLFLDDLFSAGHKPLPLFLIQAN